MRVRIAKEGCTSVLYRGDEAYRIKGAGYERCLDRLAAAGANSIRTWFSGKDTKILLDQALARGLSVTVGLRVAHERHGFDYDDRDAVARQLAAARETVEAFRNHPALLLWGIGNEYETQAKNEKVWDAVREMVRMVRRTDPDHPAMTVVAGADPRALGQVIRRLPEVDVLGINAYGDLESVLDAVDASAWDRPYVVTEWGPDGWWEAPRTSWGAAFEPLSGEKRDMYISRFRLIESRTARCLGSYAFLWGTKQERTSTWFSLVLDSGELTEQACAMRELWTGTWPDRRAPHLVGLSLDGKSAPAEIRLAPGTRAAAQATVIKTRGASLRFDWRVLRESAAVSIGGDWEPVPEEIPDSIVGRESGGAVMTAPPVAGPYRLYVKISDGFGNAATGNIPFFVDAS